MLAILQGQMKIVTPNFKHLLFLFLFSACFPGQSIGDNRQEVVDIVNVLRGMHGIYPVTAHSALITSAQLHAEDMAINNYYSHDSLDGRDPFDRIEDAGYYGGGAGENIAAGQKSADEVMRDWWNSPGHQANIMDPMFCDIGVGYAENPKSIYNTFWVQNFGRGPNRFRGGGCINNLLETLEAEMITPTSAILRARVSLPDDHEPIYLNFVYGETKDYENMGPHPNFEDPIWNSAVLIQPGTRDREIGIKVTWLKPNTLYRYRVGTSFGPNINEVNEVQGFDMAFTTKKNQLNFSAINILLLKQ